MSEFESPINQDRPLRILTTLLKNGTLPHALLFTGTEGVGKQSVAVALAMACNCQEEAPGRKAQYKSGQDPVRPSNKLSKAMIQSCGVCKSCKKIASGNHPDIIQIRPTGSFVKIDQIRKLVNTLAMKPYEAKIRVVILCEASTMNAASSNALLKLLEEPPDRTVLILIAPHKSDLLPTIVSRCQHIGFNPISKEILALLLKEKHAIGSEEADILAAMSKGSFSRARLMIKNNWLQRRKWLLDEMNILSLQPIVRLFALAEKLSKDRETVLDNLAIIQSWFRDLIISQYDPGKIINCDAFDDIRIASQQMNLHDLLSKVKAVQNTQNRLAANTNLRLAMEDLLIQLAQPERVYD